MRLGIRVATVNPEKLAMALPAFRLAEVYCVETGETVEGVSVASITYPANGVVTAELTVFPCDIDGSDNPLFQNRPVPEEYAALDPKHTISRDDRGKDITRAERAKLPANDHPAADTAGHRRS